VILKLEKGKNVENIKSHYIDDKDKSNIRTLEIPNDENKRCPKLGEYKESNNIKVVDCFPGAGNVFCHKEYKTWIKKNCPNFNFSY